MNDDAATIAFAHAKAAEAKPWVRPFVMEALVRNGCPRGIVLEEFGATDDERARVGELLARPPLYTREVA